MMSDTCSISDVQQDLSGKARELFHAEVPLVKTGIREEAKTVKRPGLMLVANGIANAFAILFFLLVIDYAWSVVVRDWAAALFVALIMALFSIATLIPMRKRMKRFHPTTERKSKSLKENVQWIQQSAK